MVSEIEIRLRADIARLQQDMNDARRAVGSGLDSINAAVGKTIGLLGGLAIGAAAVNFGAFIKQSIDAADALNDMSARTKVAIEDLAGLSYAAKLGDTSLEGVAASINKLGQNIGKDTEKFRELGVTATDPLEAFKQLAEVFKNIEDPQQRAAFGAEALGKSWQDSAVLLDGGAAGITALIAKGKELSGITEQVAADAGKFNDQIDTLGFAAQGVGTRIAASLLPMLNLLVEDLTATGDGADKAADAFSPLTETIRALVIVAGNVGFTFKAVGTEIGGLAAQVVQFTSSVVKFFSLDIKGAAESFKNGLAIGDDMKAEAEKSREAFDKWEKGWLEVGKTATAAATEVKAASGDSVEAGKKVAAFLKAGEIEAARKKVADEAAAAAKKEQEAYTGLIGALREKSAANQYEIRTGRAMTESQKAIVKLDEELRDGKLKLTPVHEREVRALLDTVAAQDAYLASAKATKAAIDALNDERNAAYSAAVAEADANDKLVATFGMSKEAIEAVELARIKARLAQRADLELTQDEVAELERLIVVKERSARATTALADMEKQKKATEEAAAEQKKFWESIDDTAHATFTSILDGGKGLAQRLKDTLKNTFFDWLYQMTIKKWIINVQGQMATSTVSGAASALQATGASIGGSTGGALGLAGTALGVGAGAVQTAGALLAGNIGFGSTISAGLSALSTGTASGIAAGLSSLGGVLLPVVGGIAAAVTLFSKAFGHGPKEVTSQGIFGELGPGGASLTNYSNFTQKGGWFSSNKSGTDTTTADMATVTSFGNTYKMIVDASRSFATALGVEADSIANRSQTLDVKLGQDAAANEKAITDFFVGVANTVALELVPNLADFTKAGETTSGTLQRVATDYLMLDDIFRSIGSTFGAVGIGSLAARERLIELSGGMELLVQNVNGFAQNFLTEAERLAPVQESVRASLAAMGLSWVDTREEFKAVTLGLDKTTEAGAQQFAQLIALQGAFAEVYPAIEVTTQAVKDSSAALEQRTALQKQLDQLGMTAAEIERAGIDATNLALYDLLQTRKAEIQAAADQATAAQATANAIAKAQADAAASLAAVNKSYDDQIAAVRKARMSETEQLALERAGLDATTQAKFDYLNALKAEDAAMKAQAEAQVLAAKAQAEAEAAIAKARDAANAAQIKLMDDYIAASNAASQKQQAEQQAIAAQYAAKETELFNLTHTAAEQLARAREMEMDATYATIRPLQEQINAMKDQATAASAAATELQAAADKARAVAAERASIDRDMLQLQGDTLGLRALDLAAIDPANRAAKEAYYAAQDKMAADQQAAQMAQAMAQAQQRAAEESARAAEEQKRAAEALAAAWTDATKSILDEVARIRGVSDSTGATSYAQAQAEFATATAQARAGDLEAAKMLPALSRTLLDLAETTAVTAFDLRLARAQTAASLSQTAGVGQTTSTPPGAATVAGTPSVPVYSPLVQSNASTVQFDLAGAFNAMQRENRELQTKLESALVQIAINTGQTVDQLEGSTNSQRPLYVKVLA